MPFYSIYLASLNSSKNFKIFSLAKILQITISSLSGLGLYYVFGINGMILGISLGYLLFFNEFKNFFIKRNFSLKLLKTKYKFITHVYSEQLFTTLSTAGDKVIIGLIFGFTLLAEYQFAMQYFLVLNFLSPIVWSYFLPYESEGIKKKNEKILFLIVTVIVIIFAILLIPSFVSNFFPKYVESIIPMQVMSLAMIPWVISALLEVSFVGKEFSNYVLYASITQTSFYFVLFLSLGIILGVFGLAIAFLISIICRAIFSIMIYKKLNMK